MAFTIALILICFGVLFLALKGFFGTFPDNWEWVGIVMAGVGVAIAAPSIFQILWGRPLVETEFKMGANEDKRFLFVSLKNPPIKNQVLRKLGIRRDTVQSLEIEFGIKEFGSGKIIEPIRHAMIYTDEEANTAGKFRVALPPTFSIGANFMVIVSDTKTNKAFIPPDRLRQLSRIQPGYYQANILLVVDGNPMRISRQFRVGRKADDLIWAKSN